MCKTHPQIKVGQVGKVVEKLSSKLALVEFQIFEADNSFIDINLVKLAYGNSGEGLALIKN